MNRSANADKPNGLFSGTAFGVAQLGLADLVLLPLGLADDKSSTP
jgi:hypothetical protein